MILENEAIRAFFSGGDGRLTGLYDKAAGRDCLGGDSVVPAFRAMTTRGIGEPEAVFFADFFIGRCPLL